MDALHNHNHDLTFLAAKAGDPPSNGGVITVSSTARPRPIALAVKLLRVPSPDSLTAIIGPRRIAGHWEAGTGGTRKPGVYDAAVAVATRR